eukprot:TRINITY_DN2834_c0_g7_i1.p1 TRINITY_DN2834_c0_g7~~TRINITY_DN2834_c0_g7_i1.p1  ORF type:complete len:368 (-),score=94.98 TRINITY_DN2834_c0_g7_i1:52-1155(-)
MAMDTIAHFFGPEFWLPPGAGPKLEEARAQGVRLPHYSDVVSPTMIAFVIGFAVLRIVLEATVFKYLAKVFVSGQPNVIRKSSPHPRLPEFYDKTPKPTAEQYIALSEQTKLRVVQVTSWFKAMQDADDLATNPKKWTETCWRLLFYSALVTFGWAIAFTKPYLWETKYCWIGYPLHEIDVDVQYYYLFQLGVYMSLLVSQFFDVQRKDFLAMFIHHIVTILLVFCSYACNYVRIGVLVLLCHDTADVALEFAKLAKYAGYQFIADLGFVAFTLLFFVFRLVIFPFWVIHSTLYEGEQIIGPFLSHKLFVSWLLALLVLHVYWFGLIVRVIYNKIILNREVDDVREDDDEIDKANESEALKLKQKQT